MTLQQMTALQALPDKYLTAEQAAYLLSIGRRTLWRLLAKGELPAPARLSRKTIRFSRRALLDYMARRTGTVVGARPILIRDFVTGEEEFYRPAVAALA
jgi:excisionase family DNA binding protein